MRIFFYINVKINLYLITKALTYTFKSEVTEYTLRYPDSAPVDFCPIHSQIGYCGLENNSRSPAVHYPSIL